MKKEYACRVFLFAAVLLLASCDIISLQSRLTGHSETWKKLAVADRERLLAGDVRVGDTEEMVLIAYDKPRRKLASKKSGEEKQSIWVYERVIRTGGSGESFSMPPPIQGSSGAVPNAETTPAQAAEMNVAARNDPIFQRSPAPARSSGSSVIFDPVRKVVIEDGLVVSNTPSLYAGF